MEEHVQLELNLVWDEEAIASADLSDDDVHPGFYRMQQETLPLGDGEGWDEDPEPRDVPTHQDFIENFESMSLEERIDYIREFATFLSDYKWEPYEDTLTEELCLNTSRIVDAENKWNPENQYGTISAYADARWAPYQFCLLAPRMVQTLLSKIDEWKNPLA